MKNKMCITNNWSIITTNVILIKKVGQGRNPIYILMIFDNGIFGIYDS